MLLNKIGCSVNIQKCTFFCIHIHAKMKLNKAYLAKYHNKYLFPNNTYNKKHKNSVEKIIQLFIEIQATKWRSTVWFLIEDLIE